MDPLTLLVIILIVLLLFGGYGYRSGWHTGAPAVPSLFGILVAIIIIVIVLRLLGLV
jgi:hypothetical protein